MNENKIVLITAFYNNEKYIENCINSIVSQDYKNWTCVLIDDCSKDKTVEKLPYNYKRFIIELNKERKTALPNIHNAILNYCKNPKDIIVILDGDDKLFKKNSLSIINKIYKEKDPWFMYGQAVWSDGKKGIARPIPEKDGLKMMRTRYDSFFVSHIRTFRAGLYHKIKEQDSEYSCLKDSNGEFYKSSCDLAISIPMCEIAGIEKIYYNEIPLYWYNRENEINDDKVNLNLQLQVHYDILKKKPFEKINKLYDGE
jgi:glycosyltransferase involved in cell wall biosynthesis